MRNKNQYLLGFILILCFNCSIQLTNTNYDKQKVDHNSNILNNLSTSNSVAIDWFRTWGGSELDRGNGIVVDSSDNIYLAGYISGFGAGNSDLCLVKFDNNGNYQWDRTWGGIEWEVGSGVAVDSSDNIYVVGTTYSFGAGNEDMILVKYNSSGVQLWNQTWGGIDADCGEGVVVDSSDNIYLAGDTKNFGAGDENLVLVKYNSSGTQLWNCTWGGSQDDFCHGVILDSSDNLYITGFSTITVADMVLVKYNSSGVQQWNQTWSRRDDTFGEGVAVDSVDNIYVFGCTYDPWPGWVDMVLVKYNSSGVQQWNRTWGGSDLDIGEGVAVDSSDNIYVTGRTTSFGAGNNDIILVKYNNSGVQLWNQTWGGSEGDMGFGIALDSSDNIYIAGGTTSFGVGNEDMILIKFGITQNTSIPSFFLLPFLSTVGIITIIYIKKKYLKGFTNKIKKRKE
jgi:uncharacterized delta-60 repeat protein